MGEKKEGKIPKHYNQNLANLFIVAIIFFFIGVAITAAHYQSQPTPADADDWEFKSACYSHIAQMINNRESINSCDYTDRYCAIHYYNEYLNFDDCLTGWKYCEQPPKPQQNFRGCNPDITFCYRDGWLRINLDKFREGN